MKLIAGNWKMNGLRAEARALAVALVGRSHEGLPKGVGVLICPPTTALSAVADIIAGSAIALGGQDCSPEPKGAFTGDVSAAMLVDCACTYVILGHSERRQIHGETDATVAAKAKAAQSQGLTAIVCVGESAEERLRGSTLDVVRRQIAGSLPSDTDPARLVVAYEPVWAIGSGRTPTVGEVGEVHAAMRRQLVDRFGDPGRGIRLLYGGSVNAQNAAELLKVAEVDGALVGGASLKAGDFWTIVSAAA